MSGWAVPTSSDERRGQSEGTILIPRNVAHAYRLLLTTDGVSRLVGAAALSRLTTSMLALSLLLAVLGDGGNSFARAGLVLSGNALAVAIVAPVSGRLADRFGARLVLLGCSAMYAVAFAGLLLALRAPVGVPVTVLAAAAVGAATPRSAPVTRAQWSALLTGDQLRTAYAFDSALNSAAFVAGPLLVGGLVLAISPYHLVALTGVLKVVGDLTLATTPCLADRQAPGQGAPPHRLLGPLGVARVRLLLVVVALDTLTYGCVQIAAPAAAHAAGATALLLAALAVGEVTGGLAFGARRWPGSPRPQLVILHLISAAMLIGLGLLAGFIVVCGLYVGTGVLSGARDTLNQLLLGEAAIPGRQTETFAWLTTATWAGYSIGATAAGLLKAHFATDTVYLLAASAALLAAAATHRLRDTPTQPSERR